jgi:hypothetical protein
MEMAVSGTEWFGKQIGDDSDGMIETEVACAASGLEMDHPDTLPNS